MNGRFSALLSSCRVRASRRVRVALGEVLFVPVREQVSAFSRDSPSYPHLKSGVPLILARVDHGIRSDRQLDWQARQAHQARQRQVSSSSFGGKGYKFTGKPQPLALALANPSCGSDDSTRYAIHSAHESIIANVYKRATIAYVTYEPPKLYGS